MYTMCQVKLVLKQGDDELNKVNREAVDDVISDADVILDDVL